MKMFGLVCVALLVLSGCSGSSGADSEVSRHNGDESHKEGQDCLTCHVKGGKGDGEFTLAGTVYDASKTTVSPNGLIKLYTQPNGAGELVANIEVDGRGNFFTTSPISFGSGLYVGVTGSSGKIKFMQTAVVSGACNSCHGSLTETVWID